jgi:hypothetical protein
MSPAAGLWVATRRGDYAGMVERSDGSYHARSARGRALGSFPDLDSALSVVDGGDEAHRGAPRGAKTVLLAIHGGAAAVALGLAFALVR